MPTSELMPKAKDATARTIRAMTSARRSLSLLSGSGMCMVFIDCGLSFGADFLFIRYKMAMTMNSSSSATHTPSSPAKAMTPLRHAL